ncbi:hypothetical protein [Treponema pectinovorum]|uniref:hypothetical protein n=1 Tax=Treponema pectinovorum TaxID=164 RepID=UPI003D8A2898
MKRLILIIISYTVLSFALCLALSAFFVPVGNLLKEHRNSFIIYRGILYFFRIMPSIFASIFMVGLSIHFKDGADKAQFRFSPVVMAHFRTVMLLAIFLVALMTLAYEIWTPILKRKREYFQNAPHLLSEYSKLGYECLQEKNYVLAHRYGSQILKISPKNPDGKILIDKSEAVIKAIKKISPFKEQTAKDIAIYDEAEGETVTSLIKKSKQAAQEKKWFESHYFAQLALSIGTNNDVNIDDARRLASLAWNELNEPPKTEKNDFQQLFEKKRLAYKALSEGDSIDAYYRFKEISLQDEAWSSDPDVREFLEISRQRVENQCFFIDETDRLETFEKYINVYFSVKKEDGSSDVIYIQGITPLADGAKLIHYLRGLSVTSFDEKGNFIKSFTTPYAKMVGVDVSSFSAEILSDLGIKKEVKNFPYILLKSIDRNNRDIKNLPKFEFADSVSEEKRTEENFCMLAISMQDFNNACDASLGLENMNLISLMNIGSNAENLGFSREVLGAILIKRITFPIIMLMLLIFLASVSWNFRPASGELFKFIWIFTLPICTTLCDVFIQVVVTVGSLFNFLLISLAKNSALLICSVIWILLLFLCAIFFALRKSS